MVARRPTSPEARRTRMRLVWKNRWIRAVVPDISTVLLESHRLVEKELLSDDDYRDFVFTYPAQLHLKADPEFFAGTAIADAVATLNA